MPETRPRSFVLPIALFAALGFAAAHQAQDPELALRVKALEERSLSQEKALALAEERVAKLEKSMAETDAFLQSLPSAAERLNQGIALTLKQGFTQAGVNYTARETLLDTLKRLGQDLTPKAKADEKAKTR